MANGNATSTEAKYTGLCASGGEYTIKPTDIGITVSCNHKGHGATIADSGGGGNNEENVLKIPETPYDLPLPNTYYDYNKQSYINYLKDQQSTSNIPKGTAIYLGKEGEDGTFYVAIGNISVTNGITQGSVFNEGAFIKINSEREGTAPASWTEAKEGETYRYGDVCLYEGEYYVCSMGSTETPGTVTKGNIYNLETNSPKSSPGIWTKIIL